MDASADDIKKMAVRLAVLIDSLESRGEKATQQTLQAAQSIHQVVQDAAAVSQRVATQSLEDFRRTAAATLAEGIRPPLDEAGRTLQASLHKVLAASNALEQRLRALDRLHTAHAWKAFLASAIGSLAVIGVAVYMSLGTHREIARADWVSQINAAIAGGKLAPCPEGGLCARLDNKRWARLDK